MKIDKNDLWITLILGSLEKLTLIFVILKFLNVIKLNWFLTLIPLWLALVIGALIGSWWFIVELIEVIKENPKDKKEFEITP